MGAAGYPAFRCYELFIAAFETAVMFPMQANLSLRLKEVTQTSAQMPATGAHWSD